MRADGDPADLTTAIHLLVAEMDPTLPVSNMRSMDDLMWEAVARPRFLTFLLATFAGVREASRAVSAIIAAGVVPAALELMRATGDRIGEARTLNHAGLLDLELGETREALVRFGQALDIFRALEKGDWQGTVLDLVRTEGGDKRPRAARGAWGETGRAPPALGARNSLP